MSDPVAINQPLADLLARELEDVSLIFERQLASELSAVNSLCIHVERYRGKMLRPTLVILSALAARGTTDPATVTDKHRTLAAVVEMIHMATLVHDDVLDEAEVRRKGATVSHLWGNEAAVMLGDYLISNAFHLCSTMGDPALNLALGEVTNTLCEGELSQLHHRNDHGLDELAYFDIVRRKTASLIAACCQLGARVAGADEPVVDALHRAGTMLGIAFQIQDDLLDLIGDEAIVGKSLGKDLEKGKLTLPIIHCLARSPQAERGELLRIIADADVTGLREHLRRSGAVDETTRVATELVTDAQALLGQLPESDAREMFMQLADAIVSRRM